MSRITIEEVKLTPEQVAARQKMLASPCPYCSDPKLYQRELTEKGRLSHTGGVAPVGKFWAKDDESGNRLLGMVKAPSYDHGDYFRITFGGKQFIPRFKDFGLEIISFESKYSPFYSASNALLFMLSAAPPDIARNNKFSFNVARVTHKKSPVVVDAHTWFSHGTVLIVHHVPQKLTSADVTAMQEALEFFKPETRGTPKLTTAAISEAIKQIAADSKPTQAAAAKALEVSESALEKWRRRNGFETWGGVVETLS
jgi:DNA-binding transcriptional regulator YiaG